MKTEIFLASAACLLGLFCAQRGVHPLRVIVNGLINIAAVSLFIKDAIFVVYALRTRWQEYRQSILRTF